MANDRGNLTIAAGTYRSRVNGAVYVKIGSVLLMFSYNTLIGVYRRGEDPVFLNRDAMKFANQDVLRRDYMRMRTVWITKKPVIVNTHKEIEDAMIVALGDQLSQSLSKLYQ